MPNQPRLIDDPSSDHDTKAAAARRERYLERLRAYLQDPEFRAIEGFPIGEDEDILALSDPPYYTACPNPFLPEIIEQWQAERAEVRAELGLPDDSDDNDDGEPVYHREPFAADVSEGKYSRVYQAFPYHTKVPFRAIMRYILHYTEPGDIVFDGFSGTGMTGVAAQLCGDREKVEELGYRVTRKNEILDKKKYITHLGSRKAILVDLSPVASFIAYNYNISSRIGAETIANQRESVLDEVEEECGWMYETWHPDVDHPDRIKSSINYTVWSDVFVCPECGKEIVFWDVAVDRESWRIKKTFHCPSCDKELDKGSLDRAYETFFDGVLGKVIQQGKQKPVLIHYYVDNNRFTKEPDQYDLDLLERIKRSKIPYRFPTKKIPSGDKTSDPFNFGVTHVHHYYTKRNLWTLAAYADKLRKSRNYAEVIAVASLITKMYRFRSQGGSLGAGGGILSGTLYIPSLSKEIPMIKALGQRINRTRKIKRLLNENSLVAISTCSHTDLAYVEDSSVDYIFTDPPFGSNLMYSELNYIWESWLNIFTNVNPEAIVNDTQNKDLNSYLVLMTESLSEAYRILKPSRWITVEFHNSKNQVWNAIQESLLRAGFIVADVRTFDKRQGTFNQVTATGSVKQDLIISAYKPRTGFEQRFASEAGTPQGAWDFVRQHLAQLPVVVTSPSPGGGGARGGGGQLETLSERQDYLLFDRMVAFHIQRGATVPLSAPEFYAGLRQRFVERDGMFFLPEQVAEYDRARLEAESVAQLSLFVDDEKTAVQWLRQQLDPQVGGHPQTYQELQPQFLQQLHQARHEDLPELSEMLEQNFLQDDADRWYVPDPSKASDLEKLRRKALLREFKTYLEGEGRLRKVRTEAVRAGFADAWQRKDYATIVQVAERLDESVLQEDPELLMYYDNASLRFG